VRSLTDVAGTIQKVGALYPVRTSGVRTARPQRRGRGLEHDEEEDMPKTDTNRIADLLRQALRRLDDWTLLAFNPRYPGPADR